jgi:dihydrofolate reductase
MRKLTFGVANSLDHFIARTDHSVDWILWSDEGRALMEDSWQGVDTLLMGRKTYEVALAAAASEPGAPADIRTYVFSRSLRPDPDRDRGAEIVGDAVAFVRELKEREGKDILLMGGGEVARPLLEAGLVDELGLNVHPVLLGSGVPLFSGLERQIDLELVTCKQFSNGCVYLHYRVLGGSDAAQ